MDNHPSAAVSALIGRALEQAAARGLTVEMVADKMTVLMGVRVTAQQVQGWADPARTTFNVSAAHVPAFETVCGTTALTEWLAAMRDATVVFGVDVLHAHLGRLIRENDDIQQTISALHEAIEHHNASSDAGGEE
jgi:hypothetical protein